MATEVKDHMPWKWKLVNDVHTDSHHYVFLLNEINAAVMLILVLRGVVGCRKISNMLIRYESFVKQLR